MESINNKDELYNLKSNSFLGTPPIFGRNAKIVFKGKNNIFYCEQNVSLDDTRIIFAGDNSLVYLSSSKRVYKLNIAIRHDSIFFSGKDNYFNKTMEVVLSEQKNVFLGSDCLFSYGICLRVADPHIVYNVTNKERINLSKSIYIGDHVWIGQQALILKGTHIGSGAIIGGMAVLAGKKVPSNTSWAGNPARQIADNVFFTNAVVHAYRDKETQKSMRFESDKFIYEKDSFQMKFEKMEQDLTSCNTAKDKLEYLSTVSNYTHKNRFFI